MSLQGILTVIIVYRCDELIHTVDPTARRVCTGIEYLIDRDFDVCIIVTLRAFFLMR